MDKELNGKAGLLPPDDQLDLDWDEVKLAQLLGFDDDLNGEEVTGKLISEGIEGNLNEGENTGLSHDSNQNVITQSELFDDPQTGKTRLTLSGNPLAKFGVVGLGLLVVFGCSATFLNTIMNSKLKSAPSMVAVSEPETKETKVESQEAETGKFKAQLAFSTSTTTRSSSPNLLGAVLEGGFSPLTKQILQRNDRDIEKMLQRQDVWYVRAGTNVQVFVNQSFEI